MFKTVGEGGGERGALYRYIERPSHLINKREKKKKKEKMSKNFEEVRRSLTMTDVMLLTSIIAHLPD